MKSNVRAIVISLLAVFLLAAVAGCSVSQKSAEETALQFANEKARFFTKAEGNASVVSDFKYSSVNSYSDSGNWVVLIRVESVQLNQTKSAQLIVEVDGSSGKVVKFNGVPVK